VLTCTLRPGSAHVTDPHARSHLTRRALIKDATVLGAGLLLGRTTRFGGVADASSDAVGRRANALRAEPQPGDAIAALLAAMQSFPLVAIGERHGIQQMSDFIKALLFRPETSARINDVVVEFGNALHQDIADRFILTDHPVTNADLPRIWRFTIGGGVLWDSPMYADFFHAVRALNQTLPANQRIRVLLGDSPFDHRRVRGPRDKQYLLAALRERDTHYAGVVEREVLAKGRRALLLAGANHLKRGLISGTDSHVLDAGGQLAQRHPGELYVADLLVVPPGAQAEPLVQQVETMVGSWRYPSVAPLADSWLGELTGSAEPWVNSAAYLAATPQARRYGTQADAVLYLGPGSALTASRPAPALYQRGPYRAELQRLSRAETQILGEPVNMVAEGLRLASGGRSWFATNGPGAK
jgi:hypothetical protein